MPASMADRIEQNLTSYFELWVELGCSWGAVEAHEERLQQQTGESDEGYSWMYGFQVKAEFPKSLADGWIRSLKNDPERYIPDEHLPDDDGAAMFKILRSKTAFQDESRGEPARQDLRERGGNGLGRHPEDGQHHQWQR